jgi:hypothetical protein
MERREVFVVAAFTPRVFVFVFDFVVSMERSRGPSGTAPKSKTPRQGRGVLLYERKYTTTLNVVKSNFEKNENIFKFQQINHLPSSRIAVPHGPQCYNSPPEVPMRRIRLSLLLVTPFLFIMLAVGLRSQATEPVESAPQQPPTAAPTAAELSKKETVSSAFLRNFQYMEYGVRSAAEAMPEIIWHNADHNGQMVLYLAENGIVPPASRPNPPPLSDPK